MTVFLNHSQHPEQSGRKEDKRGVKTSNRCLGGGTRPTLGIEIDLFISHCQNFKNTYWQYQILERVWDDSGWQLLEWEFLYFWNVFCLYGSKFKIYVFFARCSTCNNFFQEVLCQVWMNGDSRTYILEWFTIARKRKEAASFPSWLAKSNMVPPRSGCRTAHITLSQ